MTPAGSNTDDEAMLVVVSIVDVKRDEATYEKVAGMPSGVNVDAPIVIVDA